LANDLDIRQTARSFAKRHRFVFSISLARDVDIIMENCQKPSGASEPIVIPNKDHSYLRLLLYQMNLRGQRRQQKVSQCFLRPPITTWGYAITPLTTQKNKRAMRVFSSSDTRNYGRRRPRCSSRFLKWKSISKYCHN